VSKFMVSLIIIAILPFTIGALTFIFWYLLQVCFHERFHETYKRNTVSMLLIFIFLLYPTIVNYTFELFNCTEIEGAYYLKRDFKMTCW